MIVADVNLLAYFWIRGEKTEEAQNVFIRDPHWVAPAIWQSEFRNLLLGYVRKNLFSMQDARFALEKVEAHMREFTLPIHSKVVMDCAETSSCSAYDCEYVALAKELQVSLVTSDKKILREFADTARSMKDFLTGEEP